MANELPHSGRWAGYYLYGPSDSRHGMKLTLAFRANGAIKGEGVDDIAPFLIRGRFDVATNAAYWTKAYVGMHMVEYSGLYCQRAICGDWTLMGLSGGFWIWPESETAWEHAVEDKEIEESVVTEPSHEPDPVRKAIYSALGPFVSMLLIENSKSDCAGEGAHDLFSVNWRDGDFRGMRAERP